ncbi:5'-3' exonuclease [Mycoplasma sp. Pen4]|uniref:5'-3' exonuclease n=1 Tax=Mycoplasma sp. Pen4 TaxID=640330 RepID=UPI0016540F67|nr:5'-3' exonuclease [Mycoplasma sp. Pen4]QNM93839.1 5'-3' exonuclease [Mycoplasma sp. Pen4]
MKNNNKHLVIDGNYLMFQSFYASMVQQGQYIMKNKNGVTTNAINLFLLQMIKLIKFFNPTHIFVAFDSKEKSFRHDLYDSYKDGRKKAPAELFQQFGLIKEILTKLNVPHQETPGFEADDLVAAYCKFVSPDEYKFVFSRDKDLHQLINKYVSIIVSERGSYTLLNDGNFYDKYGFTPLQVPDFKALSGDSSDNLPGVRGIGQKTAINILNEYYNVTNLYNNQATWEQHFTKSVIKKLTEGKDDAMFCLKMATLNPNVTDFNNNSGSYLLNLDLANAYHILEELELRTVISYLEDLWSL